MKKIYIKSHYQNLPADLHSPVSLYQKLRSQFAQSFLLESLDFQQQQNSVSYIGCDKISAFEKRVKQCIISTPNSYEKFENDKPVQEQLQAFMQAHSCEGAASMADYQGVFGYTAYDAIPQFENLQFREKSNSHEIPEMYYALFRFVIVFEHYHNQLYVIENCPEGEVSQLDNFIQQLQQPSIPHYPFAIHGDERSYTSDEDFLEMVDKAKSHCQAGDVFQLVLSRPFSQAYTGDEFAIYRKLRAINPSPYLFFYDFGDFSLLGASPEAQLVIEAQEAEVHPIAGTFRRTGDVTSDQQEANRLMNDPKENAEHVMLVDLARNDLGKNASNVKVNSYKEIQYFSHVIHLVSKVTAQLAPTQNPIQVFSDCFPAGTLSGAPKYKAMELIDTYENRSRNFYGGAIGYFGFTGDSKHAIIIRSAMAKDNQLHYQAGAGIVIHSEPTSELQEVHNKLAAIRNAIQKAHTSSL